MQQNISNEVSDRSVTPYELNPVESQIWTSMYVTTLSSMNVATTRNRGEDALYAIRKADEAVLWLRKHRPFVKSLHG